MCCKKDDRGVSVGKVVMITLSVVAIIIAAAAVLYKIFKKHFKITFECGDCDFCDDDCFSDDSDFEPECVSDGNDDFFAELENEDKVGDDE